MQVKSQTKSSAYNINWDFGSSLVWCVEKSNPASTDALKAVWADALHSTCHHNGVLSSPNQL